MCPILTGGERLSTTEACKTELTNFVCFLCSPPTDITARVINIVDKVPEANFCDTLTKGVITRLSDSQTKHLQQQLLQVELEGLSDSQLLRQM
nr:hypothetical protein HmN_000782000 [Hymenolepis microstoma]